MRSWSRDRRLRLGPGLGLGLEELGLGRDLCLGLGRGLEELGLGVVKFRVM